MAIPAMSQRKLARGEPSPTQKDALEKMRAEGGRLVRMSGGYWTTVPRMRAAVYNGVRSPSWSVGTRTVRAMEDRGLLVADPEQTAPDWRRDRIEPAGRPAPGTGGTP